jgi:hypothetical protein
MPLAPTTRTPLIGQARENAINSIGIIHKNLAKVGLFVTHTVPCTKKAIDTLLAHGRPCDMYGHTATLHTN